MRTWDWHRNAHERLGEHAPGRIQEADISLTSRRSTSDRGGIRARTHSSHCKSVTLSIPREEKERKKKTLTGHQPKLISLKIFPNNSLAYGLAWSTWAGLIPHNPSKPFSRFLIAKLLDDLLLIYRHKFPLRL